MQQDLFEAKFGKHDFPVVNGQFAAVAAFGFVSFHNGKEIHGFGADVIRSVISDQEAYERLIVKMEVVFDSDKEESEQGSDEVVSESEESAADRAKRIAEAIKNGD